MASAVLEVQDLSVSYFGTRALANISFCVHGETIVGILGPNGAGKTTLLKAILGLVAVDSGRVQAWDHPVSDIRHRIAYVPQRSSIDLDFPVTVEDVVMMGRYVHLTWWARPRGQDRQHVAQALDRVGMLSHRRHQIGALSGGQQQRVFLARALVQQTDLLFLDEPFAAVDAPSESIIIEILREMRDAGKTILVIHHDLNKAEKYFDSVMLLNKELVAYGSKDEVLRLDHLKQAYGSLIEVTTPPDSNLMVVNS